MRFRKQEPEAAYYIYIRSHSAISAKIRPHIHQVVMNINANSTEGWQTGSEQMNQKLTVEKQKKGTVKILKYFKIFKIHH